MGWEPTEAEKKQIAVNAEIKKVKLKDSETTAKIGTGLIIAGLLFPPLALVGAILFMMGMIGDARTNMRY